MQSHIVCECGNKVEQPGEQADFELRCPRCGRRLTVDKADIQHFFDEDHTKPVQPGSGAQTGSQTRSTTYVSAAARCNIVVDPDVTALHTSPPVNTGDSKVILGRSAPPVEDFEINQIPAKDPSSAQGSISSANDSSAGSAGSSHGSKYDLSQRVMRPIARMAVPAIPYSGAGEYGIHRILRLHQKGGMGRILVAYDQYLKREVAIKELHPEVADDDSIVRRFIGEAEITAQLEHPGIVPIYRLGQGHDGLPYYTMKMIKGETLQDQIKAYHRKPTRFALLNLIRRLVSVSKTIAFAHSKGVIHRDLKPANVMIGEYGETLVMDWGLAKTYHHGEDFYVSATYQAEQQRPELTMAGSIVGTPAFMSPEQAKAEENVVGPLSDVFSLGTVLYYLLAGQTAFSGRSTQEVLNKVRECNPLPPSHIKPNVSRGLEAICMKAMEKMPQNRYQGASEFANDLCRWLDDEPILAEKPSIWSKIRYWTLHHRSLTVCMPCVLLLSVILSCLGVYLIKVAQDVPRKTDESENVQKILTEEQGEIVLPLAPDP